MRCTARGLLALAFVFSAASALAQNAERLPQVHSGASPSTAMLASARGEPRFVALDSAEEAFAVADSTRWSGRIGTMFLQRTSPSPTLLLYNVNTGDPVINPADFNFGFAAAPDIGLTRRGDVVDLDFRYFGAVSSGSTIGPLTVPPGTALAFPNPDPTPNPFDVSSHYGSSLLSAEFNLRRQVWPNVALLAGLRYLRLADQLDLHAFDTPDGDVNIGFGTTNNLYGLQIGADAILWQPTERFRIEGALKTGVYVDGATFTLSFQNPSENERLSVGSDHTAFVGDLNFLGVYQLTDRWAVRGGYQLLWLTGVAVANEQLHMLTDNGQFSTNTSHSAFFHGALVGLEAKW